MVVHVVIKHARSGPHRRDGPREYQCPEPDPPGPLALQLNAGPMPKVDVGDSKESARPHRQPQCAKTIRSDEVVQG